jgi:hypothetical protein
MSNTCEVLPTTRPQWQKALDDLPASSDSIPAFFFAHGRESELVLQWYKSATNAHLTTRANASLA